MGEQSAPTVTDNAEQSRYEVHVEGALAGFAEYRRSDDHITFTHTEIDDAYEGQGLGSTLARHVLDAARDAGLAVHPACPFIAGYIQRHCEDYLGLVPADARSRYELPAG